MSRRPHSSSRASALLGNLLEAAPGWKHGYGLMQELGIKSGSLYPLLMRLSDDGYLESRNEPSPLAGRPARREYRLSASGVELARARMCEPVGLSGIALVRS